MSQASDVLYRAFRIKAIQMAEIDTLNLTSSTVVSISFVTWAVDWASSDMSLRQ